MYEDIRLERSDGIGRLMINRPDRRNAVRPQTLHEIGHAMDVLTAAPDVRAIVLSGVGRHFSAGAEFAFLEELKSTPPVDVKAQIYAHFQGAARRIYHCPKPTLAVVNGAAVTVGCELALACDFRLVTPTAQFQESWIRLGLMPPLGGLFLLPRLVGLGRAAELCLAGRPVGADEALRIGLASEVVPVDEADARSLIFARELVALPPLAYASAKEGLHRGLESSMDHEWMTNVSAQSVLLSSRDFAEGVAAVQERRPPSFVGR
jgi:enoyl-CoA hydratase/carnithine racemase